MMHSSRNECLDIAKGIGILLVVFGHLVPWQSLPARFIYSFHMPLFFLLAGVTYAGMARRTLSDAVQCVIRRMVLPYFLFSTVGAIVYFSTCSGFSWRRILYGCFVSGHPVFNGNLWFLVALGCASLVLRPFAIRVDESKICFVSIGLSCITLSSFVSLLPVRYHVDFPLQLTCVPSALLCIMVGWRYRNEVLSVWSVRSRKSAAIVSLSTLAALLCIAFIKHNVSFAAMFSDSLHCLMAIAGVASVVLLSFAVSGDNWLSRILSYIGKHSLVYFGLDRAIRIAVEYYTGLSFRDTFAGTRDVVFMFLAEVLFLSLIAVFAGMGRRVMAFHSAEHRSVNVSKR